jgi:hypothetical protein
MSSEKKEAPYSRLRFEWKNCVNADPRVTRGAKQMATRLCDTYVNKHTGLCWPKNATLAAKLGTTVRTIQRHYRNLEETGYLTRVKLGKLRRAHRITLPPPEGDTEHDTQHDKTSRSRATNPPPEGDATVTHYKNQGNNKGKKAHAGSVSMQCVRVDNNEAGALAEWDFWLKTNTNHNLEKVSKLLRKDGAYFFPSRFPRNDETSRYKAFFAAVVASNGKCLPG